MLKKTIKFKDLDGNPMERDAYFHLGKAELMRWQQSERGGLSEILDKIIKEQDNVKIYHYFEELIKMSYGVKRADNLGFHKSPEITEEFMETDAYSELIMSLIGDAEAAAEFVNKLMPSDIDLSKVENVNSAVTNFRK